jgi:small-conductance mechanosensitive channel
MDTQEIASALDQIMGNITTYAVLRALLYVIAGFVLARLASRIVQRVFRQKPNRQLEMLVRRGVFSVILGVFMIAALGELGFNTTVLVAMAGILTVALGFASQTSMSNLISGLFLIGERPFAVDDLIQVGDTTGFVLSIDLLSVKLRERDNTFVRIPNETILNSEVKTLTKFPIRRIDLQLGVAYKEDLPKVRQVLFEVADKNQLCLIEPEPAFIFQGFGDSSLNFQFSVWVRREEFLTLRTSLHLEIKEAFDQAGIEIPFPHRTLYTGSITDPFPISIVSQSADLNHAPNE